MTSLHKRCISFLLVLVLAFGMIPSAYAAELDSEASTEPKETTATVTEDTIPEDTVPPDTTAPEETQGEEELSLALMSLDDGIATLAETEIIGQPNAFGNLFLLDGGIDIPSFDHIQHKEHLPLYSVYLKDQPGYENNYYVAYCIEPGIELGESGGHSGSSTTVGGMTDGTGALERLSRDQVEAMGIVLLYGQREIARKADDESVRLEKLRRHAATQALIWEIASGWRSATPPYTRNNSTLYDAITPTLECAVGVWGTKFYLDGIADAYNEIAAQLEQHDTIPSFMSGSKSAAPSYEMTPNSDGTYSITLTDTNNILSKYTFPSTSNLTFSVSGNKLTVTASGPVSNVVVAPTKQVPNLDSQVFYVWEYQEQQKLMSCKTEPSSDPVAAYFSLTAPEQTSSLNLTKTTEDGKNLSGWKFGIYSDKACSTLISGPHTTDAKGKISVTGLTAQTVYVKELGHTDSAIDALYDCSSTNPQKVTLVAGETATVSFYNKLTLGNVKLIKKTNTGNNLGGWTIGLYTDSACRTPVSGSPFTTGSDGTITVSDLKPGTYYAKELANTDSYWVCDTEVKTVTVAANETATVTFTNTHYGRIAVQKHTNTGNHLGGWAFVVWDADGKTVAELTTDENGYAVTGNLPLGRYMVQEVSNGDGYWQIELGFHNVTVTAGKTVVDEWTNVEQGLGWFHKETNTSASTEGWEITIYTDEACTQEYRTVVTNENGKVGIFLNPGIYWAKETGDTLGRFDNEYWQIDSSVQKFEIKPHEDTSITFCNTHLGKLKIIKHMEPEGSAAGWPFKITDEAGKEIDGSPFTTSADGTILTGNILPGKYTVEELIPEDSLYYCTSQNPQTIIVKEGQTTKVHFTNVLRSGKIAVQKVDHTGAAKAGAEFLLEWSEDGRTWLPVVYSDSPQPSKGGCSTPGLADGRLTSGEDGTVTFQNLHPSLYYRLTETKAPDGFQLLTGYAYEGQLPGVEDYMLTLTVVNVPTFTLPETGAKSVTLTIISLCVCLAGLVGALVYLRKRRW